MTTTKVLHDTFGTKTQAEQVEKTINAVWACGCTLGPYPNASAVEVKEAGPCQYEVWLIVTE